MTPTVTSRIGAATLASLLFLPTAPAAAQPAETTPPRFDLRLDTAVRMTADDFALGPERASSSESEASAAAAISLSEVRAEAWAPQQGDDDPGEAKKAEKSGRGRWLKKHWYVPVLAAVALGVALDSGGDNDASGEED